MATINFNSELHADAIKALKAFNRANAKIAELEKSKEDAKAIIIAAMGGAEEAKVTIGGTAMTVRYKNVSSNRLDTKALKAKYPAIAEECSTTSSNPRFTVSLK